MAYNEGMNTNEGGSGNVWSFGSRGGSHGGYSHSNNDDDNGSRGGGSYGGSFGNNNSRRGGGSYGFRRQNNSSGEVEILRDAIFIQDLPKDVTRDQIFDAFSTVGTIKTDDRSGGPKIWIYKDRETNEGNGRATVTYEDDETADRAISQYNNQHIDSIGGSVRVQLAQRRPRNDNNDRGGRSGGYRGGRNSWNNSSRSGFGSGGGSSGGGRWGDADTGSGGRGFSDNRQGGFRGRNDGGGSSFRDSDDHGSYRGNRGGGSYRGASRSNGGSSGYQPY